MTRITTGRISFLLSLSAIVLKKGSFVVESYVTSGLPGHKHRAWLKQLTQEFTQHPGQLTPEMCTQAPRLLSAWAQNPYVPHTYSHGSSNTNSYSNTSSSTSTSNTSNNNNNNPSNAVFPHHGRECAENCERILKRLVDERRAGNTNAVANTHIYNLIIDIWSKSGEKGAAAQRAEEILVSMQLAYHQGVPEVQPDLNSFKLVLTAWSRAKGEEYAPHRAQRLLEWMMTLHDSGANNVIQPDAECYEIVLSTWAHSGHPDAPRKTEQLVMKMDRRYQADHQSCAKPTRVHFHQVVATWSKSIDSIKVPSQNIYAALRAQDILHHMTVFARRDRDLEPSISTYGSVISAWAKSKTEDCGQRADAILRMAEKRAVVKRQDHHDDDVLPVFFPDTIMFNQVIDAHAKESSSPKSYRRARAVLDRQIRLYKEGHAQSHKCKPDVYSYTGVLSACASVNGTRKDRLFAFQVARDTYLDMLRANVSPNHVTYGTLLKACARLLPEGKERRKYTREYFRKACADGCVGEMVMNRLEEAASYAQYRGLLNGITKSTLPEEWIVHVPENEKRNMKKSVEAVVSLKN
jgi:hypothetical protein